MEKQTTPPAPRSPSTLRSTVERFFLRHNTLARALAVPASFVFDKLMSARSWYTWTFRSSPHFHDQRVRRVQEQVLAWKQAGGRGPMCTARKPWMTISPRLANYKDDCTRIEIDLGDILAVDTQRRTVRLEPLVTMAQLSRHLLPLGFSLPVMIEMDDLTIGGVCMGLGMATSSHREGLIQETVEAYEVVLGDGSLVRATRTEHADLFYALPWSHGTLGLLVALELRIVPVKPYVHLQYLPFSSRQAYCAKLEELACADDAPDFLEATLYSQDSAVIMAGRFADKPTGKEADKLNHIGRWYKPWFFKHVQGFLSQGPSDEYIPLRQYYHRHTRAIFWEIENLIPIGNHPLYRWLLGWLGAPKVSFLKLLMSEEGRREMAFHHVVQDIMIPISKMEEGIMEMEQLFRIYPVLVYPIRIYDHDGDAQGRSGKVGKSLVRRPAHPLPGRDYEMFVDLGVYGLPKDTIHGVPWDGPRAIRALERYTRKVGGYQLLYADTFMTRKEFEQMLDHRRYRELRRQYGAEGAFPEVYDKVKLQLFATPVTKAVHGDAASTPVEELRALSS